MHLSCLLCATTVALAVAAATASSSPSEQQCDDDAAASAAKTMHHLSKRIIANVPRPRAHWVGDGFKVFPVFGQLAFTEAMSPFLMFDYGAPKKFAATTKRRGVGSHPHRGFETITIAFQGEVEHADSAGNSGVIGPGDVQWMTAGRGIVHNEYHSASFAKSGGVMEMCQLWLNLPAAKKMIAPKYQPILSRDIPAAVLFDDDANKTHGHVRVIAGSYGGVSGPAETHTPVEVWDVKLETVGKTIDLALPAGHNTMVFVRRGGISVVSGDGEEEEEVGPQGMLRLALSGTLMRVKATQAASQLVVLAGAPIDEPIASQGPFVMNTQEEIRQAIQDYNSGRFGR